MQLVKDEPKLIDLVAAVQALTARTALGHDLPVAISPSAQCLRRDTEHLDHSTDAVDTALRFHADRLLITSD